VRSLGFRGEALASIAEVSRLLMRSRTGGDQAGAELEVIGGKSAQVAPCGAPVGTIVEVRQLFYNTPVRRKFLRATQTEMGHVTEAFTRIALAFPSIHFTLQHNDRPVHDLPPVLSWRERIIKFFGLEIADALIPVEGSDGVVTVSGFVANPSVSRANNRLQYFFLNGRHIRDRALQHALGEAYRGLLLTGRFPVAFPPVGDPRRLGRRQRASDETGSSVSRRRTDLQPVAGHAAAEVPQHRLDRARAHRPPGCRSGPRCCVGRGSSTEAARGIDAVGQKPDRAGRSRRASGCSHRCACHRPRASSTRPNWTASPTAPGIR
jgi:hypothetical protein